MQRCVDRFKAGAMARLLHGDGQVGFFDYRFAANRMEWTPGLCTLFGLDTAPGGGMEQWYARMAEADRTRVERELWTACALGRRHETFDYAIDLPDGSSRLLSSRILLGYGADGRPVRMTGLTVTAPLQRNVQVAQQSKDELLATVSHQLRTPLGALGAASEVLKVVDPGSPDAQEALAVIGRQTARMAQLLHEMADSARGGRAPAPADLGAGLPPPLRRKVLVVEDNSDALASICARLELDGHEVTAARDGLEGLCRLRTLAPEVSIVDIGLPRLTGFEVAQHARAAGYAGRMVALAGADAGQDAHDARHAVFDDWLVKPVDSKRLRASLRPA